MAQQNETMVNSDSRNEMMTGKDSLFKSPSRSAIRSMAVVVIILTKEKSDAMFGLSLSCGIICQVRRRNVKLYGTKQARCAAAYRYQTSRGRN